MTDKRIYEICLPGQMLLAFFMSKWTQQNVAIFLRLRVQ